MIGLGSNVVLSMLIVIFVIEIILFICYLKHLFKYRFSTVQYCRIEKKDSLKCMSITVNKIFLNNQWESIDEMIDILKKNNVDIEFELVEENEKNDI